MNSTDQSTHVVHPTIQIGCIILLLLAIALYGIASKKIFMKNKTNLEPIHIFQMNFMAVISLIICSSGLHIVKQVVGIESGSEDSCWSYLFWFFGNFCFNSDVVLMQLDRFLAVLWNCEYKSRVTANMAVFSCILSKVVAVIVIVSVALLDSTFIQCSSPMPMYHMKNTNIYLDAYPKLFVASVLISVSVYAGITTIRLDKKVHPQVHLPTVSGSLQGQENDDVSVRRTNDDPNMFSKVRRNMYPSVHEDIQTQCFNPKNGLLLVAKAAFTMNLLTMFLFLAFVPSSLLHIIYQNCQEVISDCRELNLLYIIISPFKMIFVIGHPMLILNKINKI